MPSIIGGSKKDTPDREKKGVEKITKKVKTKKKKTTSNKKPPRVGSPPIGRAISPPTKGSMSDNMVMRKSHTMSEDA